MVTALEAQGSPFVVAKETPIEDTGAADSLSPLREDFLGLEG